MQNVQILFVEFLWMVWFQLVYVEDLIVTRTFYHNFFYQLQKKKKDNLWFYHFFASKHLMQETVFVDFQGRDLICLKVILINMQLRFLLYLYMYAFRQQQDETYYFHFQLTTVSFSQK